MPPNDTTKNDRPEAVTSDLPNQQKPLAGTSALAIISPNRGEVLAKVYRLLRVASEGKR